MRRLPVHWGQCNGAQGRLTWSRYFSTFLSSGRQHYFQSKSCNEQSLFSWSSPPLRCKEGSKKKTFVLKILLKYDQIFYIWIKVCVYQAKLLHLAVCCYKFDPHTQNAQGVTGWLNENRFCFFALQSLWYHLKNNLFQHWRIWNRRDRTQGLCPKWNQNILTHSRFIFDIRISLSLHVSKPGVLQITPSCQHNTYQMIGNAVVLIWSLHVYYHSNTTVTAGIV